MTRTSPAPTTAELPKPPDCIVPEASIRWDKIGKQWLLTHPETEEVGESFVSGIVTNAQMMKEADEADLGIIHLRQGKITGSLSVYQELPMNAPNGMSMKKLIIWEIEKATFVERATGEENLVVPYLLLHADGTMTGYFPRP